MKKLISYTIIYILTVLLLFFALVVSSKIPRSAIENNLKESANYYKTKSGIHMMKNKKIYSYIHYFADTRKLNIIYCIDSNSPIESTLWSRFYQTVSQDTNKEFINLVENDEKPTTQYLRYWNGCMLFLRPLLIILNMEQIYLINKIIMSILALVLLIILFIKSKKLAIIFVIALILVSSWYVPFCIEYSVMFYVMIITSIIAIKIDSNKKNKSKDEVDEKLSILFLITGIVTTFFDFLTTEILTIFVPLLFILIIRKEQDRLSNLKDTVKFIIKICTLWLLGYAGMWLMKWIFSSIILNINAFEYVKDDFVQRINGLQGLKNHKQLYSLVFTKNIFAIPVLDFMSINFYKIKTKVSIAVAIVLVVLFIDWKKLKNKKYLLIILVIGIMPYVRYLILANHSFRHAMFTFRDQIITIMVMLYIIIECFNYNLFFKIINIRKLKPTRKW